MENKSPQNNSKPAGSVTGTKGADELMVVAPIQQDGTTPTAQATITKNIGELSLEQAKKPEDETLRRKNISGSEKKRRRKAREAQEKLDPGKGPSATKDPITGASSSGTAMTTTKEKPKGAGTTGTAKTSTPKGPKRDRDPNETPPSFEEDKKKKRKVGEKSYSDALKDAAKIAIVPKDYPRTKFTEEQVNMIGATIFDAILAEPVMPRFESSVSRYGSYLVTCSDKTSEEWLRRVVPTLKPWEGAELFCQDGKDLLRLRRVIGHFPLPTPDTTRVLLALKGQNKGLETERWMTYNREEVKDKGVTRIVFGIDSESFAELERTEGKPHYAMGRASFLLGPKKDKDKPVVEAMETDSPTTVEKAGLAEEALT